MEVEDLLKRVGPAGIIRSQKALDIPCDVLGTRRRPVGDLVLELLVLPNRKPRTRGDGRRGLEDAVKFLEHLLAKRLCRIVDNVVDRPEVVLRLDKVVNAQHLPLEADGRGLEDEAYLVVREAAALDVVGVVGEVNLDLVVDTALEPRFALLLEAGKQRACVRRARVCPGRLLRIAWNEPAATCLIGSRHPATRAVVADTTLGDSPLRGLLCHAHVVHASLPFCFAIGKICTEILARIVVFLPITARI